MIPSKPRTHECYHLAAPARSLGSKVTKARKTKLSDLARSGLRGEILLAALSLSACGSGSPSDKKTLRVDLDSWKQNSSGSLCLSTANLSDPWFNTDMGGEEPFSKLEFMLPDHTSFIASLREISYAIDLLLSRTPDAWAELLDEPKSTHAALELQWLVEMAANYSVLYRNFYLSTQ